jgi:hypothetical protein
MEMSGQTSEIGVLSTLGFSSLCGLNVRIEAHQLNDVKETFDDGRQGWVCGGVQTDRHLNGRNDPPYPLAGVPPLVRDAIRFIRSAPRSRR